METQETISGTTRIHFMALRGAVKLEKRGMKRSRGPSARSIAIKELQLPRSSSYDDVLAALNKKLNEQQPQDHVANDYTNPL